MPSTFVASFDIGKSNFAFCVEEFDADELLALQNIPKNARYNANGSPTEQFVTLLGSISTNGTTILFKNLDLTQNTNKTKYLDTKIFSNMNTALDTYKEYFEKCSIIIIEQQMSFSKAQNTMALKIGQHCFSYFLFRFEGQKEIIEFPAYYKTQILGAPKVLPKDGGKKLKAMSKPERKLWAVDKAIQILTERGDMQNLEELTKKRKRDDLADVLIQLQSFKFLRYVEKSI